MKETVIQAIEARFVSFSKLLDGVPEELLEQQLPVEKSKSLTQHLWCIIGARESYTRALEKGGWDGFACSLSSYDKPSIQQTLESSAQAFAVAVRQIADWNKPREELLVALLEHETMHEGQIIRHLYGLGQIQPTALKWA